MSIYTSEIKKNMDYVMGKDDQKVESTNSEEK